MRYLTPLATSAVILLAACSSSPSSTTGTHATTPAHSAAASAASPRSLGAAAIAARLKTAGMPIRHLIVYTPSTDPNHIMDRQGGYTSKVAWADPRAARQDTGDTRGSIGLGGGIEVYPTAAGAHEQDTYLKRVQAAFRRWLGLCDRNGGAAPVAIPHARAGARLPNGVPANREVMA